MALVSLTDSEACSLTSRSSRESSSPPAPPPALAPPAGEQPRLAAVRSWSALASRLERGEQGGTLGGSSLKEASLDSQLDNEKLSTTCMVLKLPFQICTYFVKDLRPSPPSPQLSASPAVRGGGGLGGGSVRSGPPAPWPGTAPGPRTVRGGGPAAHSETGPCWRAPALGPTRRITAPEGGRVNRVRFTFCIIENLIFFLY